MKLSNHRKHICRRKRQKVFLTICIFSSEVMVKMAFDVEAVEVDEGARPKPPSERIVSRRTTAELLNVEWIWCLTGTEGAL